MQSRNVIRTFHRMDASAAVSVLCRGQSVGTKIATGRARVITDLSHIADFQAGEILVTDMTDPDWAPIMKKAAGIITNRGGRT